MRSITPTGWSDRGFFGLGVKSFGNPLGRVSGTGVWNDANTDQLPPNARRDAGGVQVHAWTARTIGTAASSFASNVCAGGGTAMLVDSNDVLWLSINGGETWSQTAQTFPSPPFALGYAGGSFVLINGAGNAFVSSNAGVTWSGAHTAHGAGFPAGIGPGSWVNPLFAGPSYATALTPTVAWNTHTSGGANFNPSAIYDGTEFVATGNNGAPVVGTLASLTAAWVYTDVVPGTESFGATIVFEEGEYTAPILGGAHATAVRNAATPAGLATAADVNVGLAGSQLQCVLGGNGVLWAFDNAGNVAGSTDGVHWHSAMLNFLAGDFPGETFQAYDSVNHQFIAIGSVGLSISTHSDGGL